MIGICGKEKSCVLVGIGEKNGLTPNHPLNLDGMSDLLVTDIDYFIANEEQVRSLVRDSLWHRNRLEKNYSELEGEKAALLEKIKALRKLAHENRPEDAHICPEDILAITGE